jgi:hypothetical protein
LIGLPALVVFAFVFHVLPRLKRLHLRLLPRRRRVERALRDLRSGAERTLAIAELGSLRDPRAVPDLVGALATGDRTVAADALVSIGGAEVPAAVVEAASTTDDAPTLGHLLDVMRRLDVIPPSQLLVKGVRSLATSDLAGQAARELAVRHAPPDLLPLLEPMVASASEDSRLVAALLLGDLGLPEGMPHLARLLHDESSTVQRTAVSGMARIDGQEAVKSLARIARRPDVEEPVRALAALCLGERDPHALDELRLAVPAIDSLMMEHAWVGHEPWRAHARRHRV